MANKDSTIWDTILAARDWAHQKAQPIVDPLPDIWEPYAIDLVAALVIIGSAITVWTKGEKLWAGMTAVWRSVTGSKLPATEELQAAQRAEAAALRAEQRSEEVLRAILVRKVYAAGR